VAANDIAAYLIAFRALEGTDILSILVQNNSEYKAAYAASKQANLGNTATDALYAAYRWAIVTPEAENLFHHGDIKIIF